VVVDAVVLARLRPALRSRTHSPDGHTGDETEPPDLKATDDDDPDKPATAWRAVTRWYRSGQAAATTGDSDAWEHETFERGDREYAAIREASDKDKGEQPSLSADKNESRMGRSGCDPGRTYYFPLLRPPGH
jgi:hypothetical protein